MQLPAALSFLIDEAAMLSSADALLGGLGARLIAGGLPLAGGALTQSAPHPIISRRTFLWQAGDGRIVEALGFGLPLAADAKNTGRDWLEELGAALPRKPGCPPILLT